MTPLKSVHRALCRALCPISRGLSVALQGQPVRRILAAEAIWPGWLRRWPVWAAPLLTLLVLAGCIAFLDVPIRAWAAALPPLVLQVSAVITHFGDSGWSIILSLGLIFGFSTLAAGASANGSLLSRRDQMALRQGAASAAFVAAAVIGPGITVAILKRVIGRARPILFEQHGVFDFQALASDASFASFPSGHATTAFGIGLAVAFLWPRLRWPCYGVMWLAALTRVTLNRHWLSDVIAAFLLTLVALYLLRWYLAQRRMLFDFCAGKYRLRGRRTLRQLPGAVRRSLAGRRRMT